MDRTRPLAVAVAAVLAAGGLVASTQGAHARHPRLPRRRLTLVGPGGDMLLTGFPVAGHTDRGFPALRPDQVAIGLPASTRAGNGQRPRPRSPRRWTA